LLGLVVRRIKSFLCQRQLGYRLSLYIISLCFLFALIGSLSLLAMEHYKSKQMLQHEASDAVAAIHEQLALGIWEFDYSGVEVLLRAIYSLPSISAITLTDPSNTAYHFGTLSSSPYIDTNVYHEGERVGRLQVDINNDMVYGRIRTQFTVIIVVTTGIIGLLGFLVSVIIRKNITQHLSVINKVASDPMLLKRKSHTPIVLDRYPYVDELTSLVSALNLAQEQAAKSIREQEVYENILTYQAKNDVLTNLPNRRYINEYLNNYISELQQQQCLAIYFIDLDGFKEINDSQGHGVGDKVLQETTRRLMDFIEDNNGFLGRFGGDEFIAIIACDKQQQQRNLAECIIATIANMFFIDDLEIQLGCSVGVSRYPDDSVTTEDLIRKADVAMYKAKSKGQNNVVFFHPSMDADAIHKNNIKSKLKSAIDNERLMVYFQPLIDIEKRSIVGFEALVRWCDDDLGFVAPDVFIPIAEEINLVFAIDTWVFEQAIHYIATIRSDFSEDFFVSINFSPSNFYNENFYQWVESQPVFREQPDWIELEVTERLVLEDDPQVLSIIEMLSSKGIKFSIDDFGTGYSSLAYIHRFAHLLSKIKIDKMFVDNLAESKTDSILVKNIINLADSLSVEVLAEGIECSEQQAVLSKAGCQYAQGYLYSKPIPIDELPYFIASWHALEKAASSSDV